MLSDHSAPTASHGLAAPQCGVAPGTGAGLCGHKTQRTYNRLIFNGLQNMVF